MEIEASVGGDEGPPEGAAEVSAQGPREAPPEVAKRKREKLPPPDPLVGLLPLKELATALGLPFKYLRRLTREGKLPCAKIGNRILYEPKRVADRVRDAARHKNQHGQWPKDILG
jgi:hypothetical protein